MNGQYKELIADMQSAYDEGRKRALQGGMRESWYALCRNGIWLDAACLAGYDEGVDELKRSAKAMTRHIPTCPWGPPTPKEPA